MLMMSRDVMLQRLLLLLLVSAGALARPALPEDELDILEENLEEDLEELEDARAVDAAYARLFASPAVFAVPSTDLAPVPRAGEQADDGTILEVPPAVDYDYQGDQPLPDPQPDEDRTPATPNASPTASSTDLEDGRGEATTTATTMTTSSEDGGHNPAASRKLERDSIDSPSTRDRELRIHHIKSQVLSYLGLSSNSQHPMSNMSSASQQQLGLLRVVGRMGLPNLPPQDIFAEKVQSHYPSCSLPRNTDETLWSGGSAMHLLFDLPNHPPPAGTSVNVVQATLRLYKLAQGNATHVVQGPICLPTTSEEDSVPGGPLADSPAETPLDQLSHQMESVDGQGSVHGVPLQTLIGMASADDQQVRVSVFWYTRSLKKNKNGVVMEKRKLLDSRMLPVHGSSWTEWNIRTAVKVWRESGRNFGLVVEVEDEDGTLLNANQFFKAMNCTQEASTARPLPSFLLDAARRLYHSNASGASAAAASYANAFNQNLFPVIDLCTVETTDGSSGGALYSAGYDLAAGGNFGRQQKAHKLKIHPHPPVHAEQAQSLKHQQKAYLRSLHAPAHSHKHRHQHQQDVDEHNEDVVEPVARRWPRARSSQEVDDIRRLIIPQRIILAARQPAGDIEHAR